MQNCNALTDAGGHMIVEGLKGNRSVTEIRLVSAGIWIAVGAIVAADDGGAGAQQWHDRRCEARDHAGSPGGTRGG